ncbi:O-antigen ligase family protein [Metabacillus halosaccharovorans]|uniref:O-antigen ligase family protein n=1 Tax=Metabacillus halosaccharovorans TaxID=930124 RepID=A0ABT3DGR5_9BACI|nr:O-antigen ligase family protein [Metabacillus halosaccharovorans]MCV9886233.1 O-antigen ligase family protein [Metabacillus halosaccharovorans]
MVTYLAIDVLKLVPYDSFEVINDKPYRIFMGIHYHWQDVTWFNMQVARNNSIFWEPGVFQIFINLGLFYQFFLAKKVNVRQVLILLVSLFTTFSTTGFMLAILIFVVSFIKIKSKNYLMLIFKAFTVPIILFSGIYVGFLVFDQKASSTSVSYDLRSTDLETGLELFRERPFIGWGYLNYEPYEAATGTPNNSNGLVSMMFHQGIFGILFHVLPAVILAFWFLRHKNIWAALGFGVFYFMSAATEPLMYANIFNVFICLGMVAMFEKRSFFNWAVNTNLIKKPNSQKNANTTLKPIPVLYKKEEQLL